jgi:esterase/lipase superfamily enzyme
MNVEYYKWHSHHLEREMELKVYGHGGKPVILFPTQGGRFFQAEDEGIIETVSNLMDSGRIMLIAVDSVDYEAWSNKDADPSQRGLRNLQYEDYMLKEVIPFIHGRLANENVKAGCTGFSLGGYHAANYFFRHPQVFDMVIAISGFYNLKLLVGDYMDEQVYANSPNLYLGDMVDENHLNLLREGKIVICSGQGAWEEEMLEETLTLKHILEMKAIPAWIDIWGKDVTHDWPWWRKMLPYFMEKLDL